jgi:hypothetical protein
VRTITLLRGHLYRAQEGPRVTVFRVDPDGIVLVDPMSLSFARYLQQQFAERFPDRGVKYVIYSGLDLERVGGAGLFDATAETIAQEQFNQVSRTARERSPELSEGVRSAESTFATRRTLRSGSTPIDLIYPGPAAGVAQTLVYFRDEHVLFAATYPSLAAPFSDRNVRPVSVAQWTATVAEVEFDLLMDGSGATASRAEVIAADGYARAIMAGIKDGNLQDLSAAQLQSSASIARFEGTPFALVRDADIAAMYRRTTVLSLDAVGSVLADRVPTDYEICRGNPSCASPPTGLGLMAGAGFSIGSVRAVAEVGRDAVANLGLYSLRSRSTHVTFLGGYRTGPAGRFNVTVLGGLTYVMNSFRYELPGYGTFTAREEGFLPTFGADVVAPVTRDLALVLPLRFARGVDLSGGRPTSFDVRAGVGLSFTYRRRAM